MPYKDEQLNWKTEYMDNRVGWGTGKPLPTQFVTMGYYKDFRHAVRYDSECQEESAKRIIRDLFNKRLANV